MISSSSLRTSKTLSICPTPISNSSTPPHPLLNKPKNKFNSPPPPQKRVCRPPPPPFPSLPSILLPQIPHPSTHSNPSNPGPPHHRPRPRPPNRRRRPNRLHPHGLHPLHRCGHDRRCSCKPPPPSPTISNPFPLYQTPFPSPHEKLTHAVRALGAAAAQQPSLRRGAGGAGERGAGGE